MHHRSIPFDFEIKFGDAVGNIDAFFSISQLSIGFLWVVSYPTVWSSIIVL